MSNIQQCSECTYKGPSDTFPLKKSGKGHTKTCSHCNDRTNSKLQQPHTHRGITVHLSLLMPLSIMGEISQHLHWLETGRN
ncbi:hypothetical protein BS47DRAFT_1351513, partial [Hydnum rufescens UP504]